VRDIDIPEHATLGVGGPSYLAANWRHFVAEYWNRQPTVIRNALTQPLADPAEIFQALQATANQFKQDADRPGDLTPQALPMEPEERRSEVKMLFNNMRLLSAEAERLLPNTCDKNLDQYVERLLTAAGQRDVMLYVTGFQRYSAQIWDRVCSFLLPLYQLVGMPAGYADLELFIGRYGSTPGGVHKDRGTNFHFVVSGQKKMHIWPRSEYWSRPVSDGGRYQSSLGKEFSPLQWRDDLGDSVTLEAGPGDAFHWAIDHWHVGESPQLSVSLNIALYLYGDPWTLVERGLSGAFGGSGEIPSYPFVADDETWRSSGLPTAISAKLGDLNLLASQERQELFVLREWMRKTTSFGFGVVPPRVTSPALGPNDVIARSGQLPVLYQRAGNRLAYSANGHVSDVPYTAESVHLLKLINTALPARISTLVPNPLCDVFGSILQDLYRMRAIAKEF